jgi:hypothetical protein
MKKDKVHITANRIYLGKLGKKIKELSDTFFIYIHDGRVILEPLIEIPANEAWLFQPENKHILDEVKLGIEQAGRGETISWEEFKKKHDIDDQDLNDDEV